MVSIFKSNLNNRWLAVIGWRQMLPKDIFLTIFEALIVLTVSQTPFILLSIKYVNETEGVVLSAPTLIHVITENVKPGEILIYIAGILASTTAYFIMRPRLLRHFIATFFISILGPIILLFLATPTFMADRYGKVANIEFMTNYAALLLVLALALWLYSLFIQRRIENASIFTGDDAAIKIVEEVSGGGD